MVEVNEELLWQALSVIFLMGFMIGFFVGNFYQKWQDARIKKFFTNERRS